MGSVLSKVANLLRKALNLSSILQIFFGISIFNTCSYGEIFTGVSPIVFGNAAPSVPSFIGSKVIFWFTFLCAP